MTYVVSANISLTKACFLAKLTLILSGKADGKREMMQTISRGHINEDQPEIIYENQREIPPNSVNSVRTYLFWWINYIRNSTEQLNRFVWEAHTVPVWTMTSPGNIFTWCTRFPIYSSFSWRMWRILRVQLKRKEEPCLILALYPEAPAVGWSLVFLLFSNPPLDGLLCEDINYPSSSKSRLWCIFRNFMMSDPCWQCESYLHSEKIGK